jgi:hypothetical protein
MNRLDRGESDRDDEHRREEPPDKAVRRAIDVSLTSEEAHGFTLS